MIDCSLGSPLVAARSFFTVMDAIAARGERWLLFVLGGVRALLGAGEQRQDRGRQKSKFLLPVSQSMLLPGQMHRNAAP